MPTIHNLSQQAQRLLSRQGSRAVLAASLLGACHKEATTVSPLSTEFRGQSFRTPDGAWAPLHILPNRRLESLARPDTRLRKISEGRAAAGLPENVHTPNLQTAKANRDWFKNTLGKIAMTLFFMVLTIPVITQAQKRANLAALWRMLMHINTTVLNNSNCSDDELHFLRGLLHMRGLPDKFTTQAYLRLMLLARAGQRFDEIHAIFSELQDLPIRSWDREAAFSALKYLQKMRTESEAERNRSYLLFGRELISVLPD